MFPSVRFSEPLDLTGIHKNFAAVLTGPYGQPYELQTRPIPVAKPGEALVRLDYSGVCHGDVYSRDGGGPAPVQPIRPLVGGHEGIGKIVHLGDNAGNSGWKIGNHVGIAWRTVVCRDCDACNTGAENHCRRQVVTGLDRDGTFQRYIAFPIDQLIPIPHHAYTPAACPILCGGVTSYTALSIMSPTKGKWCVIVGGAGGLGHLAIQYAKKSFGLKVLVIDGGSPEKEEFCRSMGSDEYVDFASSGSGLADTVREKTQGGADYILILSPHQSAYDAAGNYARFRAQIMAVGLGSCAMPLQPVLQKNLTVRSHETGTKDDIAKVLDLSGDQEIRPQTEVVRVDEIDDALNRVKNGNVFGRLVIDFTKEP